MPCGWWKHPTTCSLFVYFCYELHNGSLFSCQSLDSPCVMLATLLTGSLAFRDFRFPMKGFLLNRGGGVHWPRDLSNLTPINEIQICVAKHIPKNQRLSKIKQLLLFLDFKWSQKQRKPKAFDLPEGIVYLFWFCSRVTQTTTLEAQHFSICPNCDLPTRQL